MPLFAATVVTVITVSAEDIHLIFLLLKVGLMVFFPPDSLMAPLHQLMGSLLLEGSTIKPGQDQLYGVLADLLLPLAELVVCFGQAVCRADIHRRKFL